MVRRRRPHFQTWIFLKPVGHSWSNFMCGITGLGERLHKVLGQIGADLGRLDQNSGFRGSRKPPLIYNGKTMSPPFLSCLNSSSFILDGIIIKVARTGITVRTSLISGRIRLLTLELLALEWRKFYTFKLEYLWSQSASLDQILCVASLGAGKGCIMFWGRLDQNSGVHGNRNPPLTYNGENGVCTFSRLLLIWSFLYLQVTRTCIKFRPDLTTDYGVSCPWASKKIP